MADIEPRSWNWAERRAIVLDRADHECAECGGLATEADHKWPRKHGGTDDFDNLQALCRKCNAVKGDQMLFEHMTPFRLQSAAALYLDTAISEAGRAAQFIAIARLMAAGEEDRAAYDAVGQDIKGLPEASRRWVLDYIAGRLGLPVDRSSADSFCDIRAGSD